MSGSILGESEVLGGFGEVGEREVEREWGWL